MSSPIVTILHDPGLAYPAEPPFDPPQRYPEFGSIRRTDATNRVYGAVRELFRGLGLDAARFGTPAWNPLGGLVRPGEAVFLKPNMIAHRHRLRDEWDSVITHGSVIRAVADYVCLALEGRGRVMIGDAPQSDSQWPLLVERMGLERLHRDSRRLSTALLKS